jgi:S-adenosylmethionine hydrolase
VTIKAPIVTLTSDFGDGSPYVAAMKAVLLAGCPGAIVVDVGHTVPAFDVVSGAFVLWAGTRHFPPGAVHIAVVDPGVGTQRRAVAFALSGSWYVGPDNGIFGIVLAEKQPEAEPVAVALARPPGASATFEGRDVFAPAAAELAAGHPLESLGRPSRRPLTELPLNLPAVLWVDRFGNLITSLRPPVSGLGVNGREVRKMVRTFSDAPPAIPFLYVGSMGFVEVGVFRGRADWILGAGVGTPVDPL